MTVYGSNQDIFNIINTCLIIHILLKVLLRIRTVRKLYLAASGGDTTHSQRPRYCDLLHFSEIPVPNSLLGLVHLLNGFLGPIPIIDVVKLKALVALAAIVELVECEHEVTLLVLEEDADALEAKVDWQVLLEEAHELGLAALRADDAGELDGVDHFLLHVLSHLLGLQLVEFEAQDCREEADGVLVDHGEACVDAFGSCVFVAGVV